MSAHVKLRAVVLAAAVALLFAGNHAIAQTPPAGSDTEQRLKALEDKMDRMLKSLEARPEAQAGAGAMAAIETARAKIKTELAAKEREHQELVQKLGIVVNPHGTTTMIAEALGKYEARRSEIKMSMQDMSDQLRRIEKAYRDGGPENGNKAALQMIRAIGIAKSIYENPGEGIVALLNQERQKLVTARGENYPRVKDVDDAVALVRKVYADREVPGALELINTMREEISVQMSKIETLTNLIDQEKKKAREMNVYAVAEERLRGELDGLRNTLKGLDTLLSGNQSQKPK